MNINVAKRHSPACKKRRGVEKGAEDGHAKCGCRVWLDGVATTDAQVRAVEKIFPGSGVARGRFRISAGTRNLDDARQMARTIERTELDIISGKNVNETSIAEACDLFLRAKRNASLEPPTIAKLEKTVARIKQFCDTDRLANLSDIRADHVETWEWNRFFRTVHSARTNQERVRQFFAFFERAGLLPKNPTTNWKPVKGKMNQVRGFTAEEYKAILDAVSLAGFSSELQPRVKALVELMRFAGLAILDASTLERENLVLANGNYRVRLRCRQKTSKKDHPQPIDNLVPARVGKMLIEVLNGNPRYVFWTGGRNGTDEEKRDGVKYWQKIIRRLLDAAGLPNATSHQFRHTLAIEMIRNGARFEDVAAALGNTVQVVARYYSHEWNKVRQHKTDDAIRAAW
jgi:site-specific recombinase XerD